MLIKVSLLKKETVAKDTVSFYFSHDGIADFFPGQYIRLILPITPNDAKGASHFFTISSSPLQKEYITITTKKGQSDFKNYLFSLKPGQTVDMFGPLGGFYLHEEDTTEKVFLGGGIGMTPFHSMITYIAEKNLPISITLIVSFSTVEEAVFYEELTTIAKEHTNIKVVYSFSRISEELIKKHVSNVQIPNFYIVGPSAMVSTTEELLHHMQIPTDHIKIEQFTGY